MKRIFRSGRAAFWILLACLVQARAQLVQPTVSQIEIKHVGPPAVSDALVRANIRVKAGDLYRPASVDDDISNLYSTGYFYNISVASQTDEKGVKLVYSLQGRPVLTEIKFVGNTKYKRAKLLKKVTSKVGQSLDDRKLFIDSQEIQKLYQKAGYQKTTVKAVPAIDQNLGKGVATFEITESPKVIIAAVEFDGEHQLKKKEVKQLKKALKTRAHWMFSWLTGSGVLKDDEFEDDKGRLVEFYQNKGFIDFELKDVKFDYLSPKKMNLRFVVSEGQQYKVGSVSFKGNNLFAATNILQGVVVSGFPSRVKMTTGKTFTPEGLNKDVEAVKDFYGSKGYIDSRIVAVQAPNPVSGAMDLVFQIDEGEISTVEKVEIKGNTKTKDKVIRRELAVMPGEVYDTVKVKLSKSRLEGLNYFEKVDTQPEETEVTNRKNLVVGVEEKNTGNFTIGAGFDSVQSLVGFAEVSQGDFDLFNPPTFTGAGERFRLRAAIGTLERDYLLTIIEPWFLDHKLALQFDAFDRDLYYVSPNDIYDETHVGTKLGLTRALGSDFLIGNINYTFEQVGVFLNPANGYIPPNSELLQEAGRQIHSGVGGWIAYDTRNNNLNPDRGQRTELSANVFDGDMGSDVNFYRVELKSDWFFRGFWPGQVLQLSAALKTASPFGGTPRVPISDRYFMGGLYDLRGFHYRTVGGNSTFDDAQNPLGGDTYAFATAEYTIPIIERLKFALFYDIGNVYGPSWAFSDLARTADDAGVGLRINLPIGPLRLDYGIPIRNPTPVGQIPKFTFGVGYTRPF
jgi:outer membrane protein insertion porin family